MRSVSSLGAERHAFVSPMDQIGGLIAGLIVSREASAVPPELVAELAYTAAARGNAIAILIHPEEIIVNGLIARRGCRRRSRGRGGRRGRWRGSRGRTGHAGRAGRATRAARAARCLEGATDKQTDAKQQECRKCAFAHEILLSIDNRQRPRIGSMRPAFVHAARVRENWFPGHIHSGGIVSDRRAQVKPAGLDRNGDLSNLIRAKPLTAIPRIVRSGYPGTTHCNHVDQSEVKWHNQCQLIRPRMKFNALTRLERNVHRAGEIIGVLAKYGLADWVKGLNFSWIQDRIKSVDGQPIPDLKIEERVRLAFTELGTTFIKLGQVLSTRPDLVGPEMARELAHLQTAAPADPPDMVRATIEAEFGKPLGNLFAQFDDAPLASASIAQVHLARLHSGEQVVVKVQHAGIADKIMPDLDILAGLAELAEKHSSQVRLYQPVAVVRQFRRTLLRELDFTFERRNLEEFAATLRQGRHRPFPPRLRAVLHAPRPDDGTAGRHPRHRLRGAGRFGRRPQ